MRKCGTSFMSLMKVSKARLTASGIEPNRNGGESPPIPTSYGGVVIDMWSRLLLRTPTNHFDGYVWTFPKGRQAPGESPRQTALREVLEETGVHAKIITKLQGVFRGGTGWTQYYLMRSVGESIAFDSSETAAVRWVTFAEAKILIDKTTNRIGRSRDQRVLSAAASALISHSATRGDVTTSSGNETSGVDK